MAVISNSDLDNLARLGADLALKDVCDILRETPGSLDTTGGHPTTWPVHATVKCAMIYDNSPRPPEGVAQQKARRTPNKILLPRGTDVLETDRIRFGGEDFTITGIPVSSYEIFRTVSVSKAPLQGNAP